MKKEYVLEQSPFYSNDIKIRSVLSELNSKEAKEVVLARKRYFKRDEYVKFIINKEFDIVAYSNLSNVGKTVLQYIIYNCLEYNTPTFKLRVSDLVTLLSYTSSTIHKGIRDLIDNNYIARTKTRETYWINHNRYYKGNFIIDKYLKTK